MTLRTKYYLRPTGFVNKELGRTIYKKSEAINFLGNYYLYIELISKVGKKVSRNLLKTNDFLKRFEKNKEVFSLFSELQKKRKTILNNKKFFENDKKNLIFSILNITPDSFSDGGENNDVQLNCKKSLKMIDDGADFIDVGGESTRPGAIKVDPTDEILRILPTLQSLDHRKINISLDTRNSETMELGIFSGVKVINDVSALTNDQKSINIIKKYNIPVVLMHMPGDPTTMMKKNKYFNITLDVYDYLEKRIRFCESMGIKKENIIIDPGIGFGKDFDQNIILLKNLSIFHTLGCLVMLGVSRKRFISVISKDSEPKERLGGTISTIIYSLMQGIQVHRVHDVKETKQAIQTFEKLNEN